MANQKGANPDHLSVEDGSLLLTVIRIRCEHLPEHVGLQHSGVDSMSGKLRDQSPAHCGLSGRRKSGNPHRERLSGFTHHSTY